MRLNSLLEEEQKVAVADLLLLMLLKLFVFVLAQLFVFRKPLKYVKVVVPWVALHCIWRAWSIYTEQRLKEYLPNYEIAEFAWQTVLVLSALILGRLYYKLYCTRNKDKA